MASKIIQGQGDGTEYKERSLGAAFWVNLTICAKHPRCKDKPYHHFDLYCGSGFNDISRCEGSPLAFWRAVELTGKAPVFAHFVDEIQEQISLLCTQFYGHPYALNSFIHHGDNASFIPLIPFLIRERGDNPEYALGSVLIDPNGAGIPWDELIELTHQCPRLDVFLNFNVSIVNRISGYKHNKSQRRVERLENVPGILGKNHVLIRNPTGGRNSFVLLVCRNIKTREHRSLGFYHWDSADGLRIRRTTGLTKAEQVVTAPDDQIALF